MSRPIFILLGLLALAASLPARPKPNVILVVSDDQHRDQANFLPEGTDTDGRPRNLTPHLDSLAASGVVLPEL